MKEGGGGGLIQHFLIIRPEREASAAPSTSASESAQGLGSGKDD